MKALLAGCALCLSLPSLFAASIFDKPELRVARSPERPRQIALPAGVRVLDYDVAPTGPVAALLIANAAGGREVQLWDANQAQPVKAWEVPASLQARSLAWHPGGNAFFVSGQQEQQWAIFKVEQAAGVWRGRQIYASRREIRRLVPGPRPFLVPAASGKQEAQAYRLFFGMRLASGSYSARTITEDGQREYQAVGPREGVVKVPNAEVDPSNISASSALPAGFHPGGHLLLWEDAKGCFEYAAYDRDHWEKSSKLFGRDLCGGSVAVTPNGAGLIHWVNGEDGVEVLLNHGAVQQREAAGYRLISAPSPVPDGRGIVGLTRNGAQTVVNYIPIQVPLADVANAWMFLESPADSNLLSRNGGLFRDLKESDQLYQLYDSELYSCGGFDESTPTRPYLVTSDSFWELFAAAYEGIFIVRERQAAIPTFWDFVEKASAALEQSNPRSRWAAAFGALRAFHSAPGGNAEAQQIAKADGRHRSAVTGEDFDFGELKPRGHYTATPAAKQYFQAFRYLTRVSASNGPVAELAQLPPPVKAAALRWIGAYPDLIAPSRAPLVWQSQTGTARSYVKHPAREPAVFPLAWGFDNEVLLSTTFHSDWPAAERIEGPGGQRLMPSAVDVAAALGSRFAAEILKDDIAKYPPLAAALAGLNRRIQKPAAGPRPNLNDEWIDALAQQWADSVASPGGQVDESLWRAKRLQTGLASWATLRHATVLVNERVSAECGEAGFEAIVMRPPRGYVEPDPEMFGRLARLFDAAGRLVNASEGLRGMLPSDDDSGEAGRRALKQGLLRRLSETAAKARLFQAMAEKEVRGEDLSASDYEEILYFGRVAEHHFLVYKSLANKDLALSTPDPMPKIADIADVQGGAPYWMVAVGRPLEWDHAVPYFGRRQVVKGAAYSFYEFASDTLLNDAGWLKKLPSQPRPAWVAPFVSPDNLSCPARNPF